jgi:hypothetical protein
VGRQGLVLQRAPEALQAQDWLRSVEQPDQHRFRLVHQLQSWLVVRGRRLGRKNLGVAG